MEKYKYKCDNNACNHEFVAENPSNCPKCGCDDFIIIGDPPSPPWVKMLIGLGIISVLAVGAYFLLTEDCECVHPTNNHKECCDKFKGPIVEVEGETTTYPIKFALESNYIEVISPPEDKFTELNFVLINSLDGSVVYREGNKFYPCADASFSFKWEDKENTKIKDENKQVNNFILKTSAHTKACESQVEYIQVKANSDDCSYSISTNLPNSDIEVSLSENSGYVRSKVQWLYKEAGDNPTFYVRKIGSDIIRSESESCTPIPPEKITASAVVTSFNLYMKDIEKNSAQFIDPIGSHNPDVVVRGESMTLVEFLMYVNIEKVNQGQSYLDSLKLTESNVIFNSSRTKILKLIIY
jgi:hypothetical protein